MLEIVKLITIDSRITANLENSGTTDQTSNSICFSGPLATKQVSLMHAAAAVVTATCRHCDCGCNSLKTGGLAIGLCCMQGLGWIWAFYWRDATWKSSPGPKVTSRGHALNKQITSTVFSFNNSLLHQEWTQRQWTVKTYLWSVSICTSPTLPRWLNTLQLWQWQWHCFVKAKPCLKLQTDRPNLFLINTNTNAGEIVPMVLAKTYLDSIANK